MLRATVLSIALISSLAPGFGAAQEPARSDVREREQARLVLVDTLAMDVERRAVADLTAGEFLLTVGGKTVPIDTFDLLCPVGAAADPKPHRNDDPSPALISRDTPRKIVLAVDYNFLGVPDRPAVLDAIESMLRMSKTPAEEIMLVALADGVRVEQRFTREMDEIVASLRRMKHDVTLWARDFGAGAGGESYFDSLATLMDVLEARGDAKVVVLFSTLRTTRDQNDAWFRDVATRAAAARTAIYPNWARGLQFGTPRHDARALQRLATETGGRPPIATSDLSEQYRRAQRDLSCRYVLGVQLDDEAATTARPVRVRVGRTGVILRYPEQVRLWSDDEKRKSRLRASFVDPRSLESPLLRVAAFPMRPVDRQWDTLLTVQLHLPTAAEDANLELTAILERGGRLVEQYRTPIRIPAAESGRTGARSVTMTADSSLKPGSYELIVALSRVDDEEIVTRQVRFEVPEIPKKGLFVKGPILARVVPGGIVMRGDKDDAPNDTALDEFLGGEKRSEPLLVHEIDSTDGFLAYWEACLAGSKNVPPAGSVVRRRFMTPDGIVAHALNPVPFEIEQKGQMRCVHGLDELAPRTLRPGEYKLELSFEKPGGESLASGSVPLRIE